MGNNMKKIVVIVPALNEETTIEDLIIRILRLKNETNNYSVLVIDDGSTDRTCELSKKSGATVVIHERNRDTSCIRI
jgi:glycosyltransferase involved in cell wall biosynthesis